MRDAPRAMIARLLDEQLRDRAAGWSVGTWGAVADLDRDPGEPTEHGELSVRTARGGVRASAPEGLRVVAYERCLRAPGSWRQALALCLPAADARGHGRSRVCALGRDRDALRTADRDAPLFDLGLGSAYADFCVRTRDPMCVAALRAAEGRSIWDAELGLARRLAALSPTRVVLTRAFRAEVTTPIPPPGGATPWGPHTHLLPKLLATGRSHPAIEPIPAGWVPLATVFPAHPTIGPRGTPIAFDAGRHARFQELLRAYGDPLHVQTKDMVATAVRQNRPAERPAPGPGSVLRSRAARVALRQLAHTDPDAPGLPSWRAAWGEPA